MEIYDPTAGSGGMLIQSKQYVAEVGGNSRNLSLFGQEDNGSTWSICKMNMILHGVNAADIKQGDTIKDPQHLDDKNPGELRRFDRVIANPPFSQNYIRKEMKFDTRFHTFMPESGKKADLMFVQHMIAVLKADGKMAVVMPHGVLFRGGEEKTARKKIIGQGILGSSHWLPSGLFYGTGIPACALVINKQEASERKSVLFINADREYKEGKNQNQLRPEDIEKITYVYRNKVDVEKYSRNVPLTELEEEEYNLNIRRYVDNSPPPEPHDVRAHLNGGIPVAEINTLQNYFDNFTGIKAELFADRDENYSDFTDAVTKKEQIKHLIESHIGVLFKQQKYEDALLGWWINNVNQLETLPETQNVFAVRRHFLKSIVNVLLSHNMLDIHKIHGACASYMDRIASDLKSVAASGWGAELIPEEDILASQFPEVLEQLEQDKSRILELEGLFASVDNDDDDGEAEESESGVLPKALVKSNKENMKALKGDLKSCTAELNSIKKDIKRAKDSGFTADLAQMQMKESQLVKQVAGITREVEEIEAKLETHTGLERELKELKGNIRESEKRKDELVAKAREKITEQEAKKLILERFRQLLLAEYQGYLRQYRQGFVAKVENLWGKYSVTVKEILAERDQEAELLNQFLGSWDMTCDLAVNSYKLVTKYKGRGY